MPFKGYHHYTYGPERLMGKNAHIYADLIRMACEDANEPLPHIICGRGNSGIPMATLIADRLGVGLCAIRSGTSVHDTLPGTGSDVTERDSQGRYILRYLFVDDIISSGATVRKMHEALLLLYPWHYRRFYGIWLQDLWGCSSTIGLGEGKSHFIASSVCVELLMDKQRSRPHKTLREVWEDKGYKPIDEHLMEPGVLCGVSKHDAWLGQHIDHGEMHRLQGLTPWWD